MASNAAAEVAGRLRAIRSAAEVRAPQAAATAAGQAGETLVKMVLQQRAHQAGTPTPSPRGEPPAKISGDLARSVQRTPTVPLGPGRAETTYGPTVVYGTVQEFGMPISVKRAQVLANPATGQVFGKHVVIPARPFMRPSTVLLITSGRWGEVTAKAWMAAIDV